jgi:ComF family protein
MDFRHIARQFAASERAYGAPRSACWRRNTAACAASFRTWRVVCARIAEGIFRPWNLPVRAAPCPVPEAMSAVDARCESGIRRNHRCVQIRRTGFQPDRRLKYHGDLSAARLLGQLLAEHIAARASTDLPELIVPVPLHPRRIMRRGFNQSIEIGRVVAKQLNIPMATSIARRIRHTPAQQTLSLDRRRHNVLDSFELQHAPEVRRIALIDDVMTSGATLDALAHCFKQHDDYEVHCWVCARA